MARALKFHAVVSGKTLSLPDLSAFEGKRVEVIVVEEEAPAETGATPRVLPSRWTMPSRQPPFLHITEIRSIACS